MYVCIYIYIGTLWQLTGICIPRILDSTCLDPLRGHGPFQHWSPSTLGNGPLPPAWAHQLCLKAAGSKMLKGTAIPPYPDISWDMTHLEPSWTILNHPICLTLPNPITPSQSSPNLRSPRAWYLLCCRFGRLDLLSTGAFQLPELVLQLPDLCQFGIHLQRTSDVDIQKYRTCQSTICHVSHDWFSIDNSMNES